MLPKKERFLVQKLLDFINNDEEYSIALIAGIRRTGKSTILLQLKEFYFHDAIYIDLSEEGITFKTIEDKFLNNPTSLLLLDEITYLPNYERYMQLIYDLSAGQDSKRFKVIMTGSSSAHIVKLRSSKLGGGRSKLFRLPPIMFIEYLYFTGRISSYTSYENVQPEDFEDYLFLKGLSSNLAVTFNTDYFSTLYDEVNIGNSRRFLADSKVQLNAEDLTHMVNLLAYKLSEAARYQTALYPEVGGQEHIHAYGLGIKAKKRNVDLSATVIADSKNASPGITVLSIKNIIYFLLHSGLANIEFSRVSEEESFFDIGYVIDRIQNCTLTKDLEELFEKISICLISPLFYTRLGSEIFEARGITPDILRKGMLFGKMLELYARGGISLLSDNTILSSNKLNYIDENKPLGEVDIAYLPRFFLCELGTDNKKDKDINVTNYYKDIPFIRVASSRTKARFNGVYHRVPYAQLCCMIDTGDILNLEKTTASQSTLH